MNLQEYQDIYKDYRAKSFRSAALIKYFVQKYTLNNVSKIVDVGCGLGKSLTALKSLGVQPVGVDVSQKSLLKALKTGCPLVNASATDLSIFKNKEFDVYLSADMFEHLHPEDVDIAISEAIRITSKYILIRVHPVMDKRKKYHLTIMSIKEWELKFTSFNLILLDHVEPNGFVFKLS